MSIDKIHFYTLFIHFTGDNNMLNFVLCDDNHTILDKLEKMIESILIQNNLSGEVVFSATTPNDIINYIDNNQFDVLILDIDLKSELSGLSLANYIRKNNKKAYIIFTTAHLEYTMVAYKYKTFDFLAKPITMERLEETILRLYDDAYSDSYNFLKIDKKNGFIRIQDVFLIQKEGKKAIFKTKEKDYEVYCSFSNILNELPESFVRCHKSYIVNLDKISNIQSDNIIIFKENFCSQCFIGPKYENFFTEVINNGNPKQLMECFGY